MGKFFAAAYKLAEEGYDEAIACLDKLADVDVDALNLLPAAEEVAVKTESMAYDIINNAAEHNLAGDLENFEEWFWVRSRSWLPTRP